MIEAFVGIPGTGKTLAAVDQSIKLLLLNHYRGNKTYRIYSNIHLFLPEEITEYFIYVNDVREIDRTTNGVFLFDEMWKWVDSRISPSKRNRFFAQWSIITRKRHLDLIYTEQYEYLIDKRIRKITEYLAKPEQLEVDHELTLTNKYRQVIHKFTTIKVVPLKTQEKSFRYTLINNLYFDLFDTFEEPQELTGDSYVDRAEEILPQLYDDDVFSLINNEEGKTLAVGHIKSMYSTDRQTAGYAYLLYNTRKKR